MDNAQENSPKEENCCSNSGSGAGCGRGCCGAKTLIVFILFLLGGVIGYLIGAHGGCGPSKACHMAMMSNPCPMGEASK